MALTANALRDEMDAMLVDMLGVDYDEPMRTQLKTGLLTVIATCVTLWLKGGVGYSGALPGADVTFDVGNFAGTDSGGDTPNNISASSGNIT